MTSQLGRGRLLRPDQVMAILNCSRSSVYRLLSEAHLTGIRVRGSIRVWEKSLSDYLDRQIELFTLESEICVSDSSITSGSLDKQKGDS